MDADEHAIARTFTISLASPTEERSDVSLANDVASRRVP